MQVYNGMLNEGDFIVFQQRVPQIWVIQAFTGMISYTMIDVI